MAKSRQWVTCCIWMATVPLIILCAWNFFPSREIDWLTFSLTLTVLIILNLYPVHFNEIKLTLDRWVTFAVFFMYGAFLELIMMQIALIFLQLRSKSTLPTLQRFFSYSTIFAITSFVSAIFFHVAGGMTGEMNFWSLVLAGLLYAAASSITKCTLSAFFFKLADRPVLIKMAIWDFLIAMLLLPLAISLYLLEGKLGNIAIFLTGIPAIIILLVVQLYHKSDRLQAKLSSATEIGHELADRLRTEEVYETFIRKLRDVLNYDKAYLFDFQDQQKRTFLFCPKSGLMTNEDCRYSNNPKEMFGGRVDLQEIQIYPNRKAVEALRPLEFSPAAESVMTVPVDWKGKTEGVLMVTSIQPYFFGELDKEIVKLLTGYFATSVAKAKLYERRIEKSERCGLTKLHNLRYLLARLDDEFLRIKEGEIHALSAIMMDIDHFKSINDTYGHQSGNDILVAFANILRRFVGEEEILARYGGEEFVLVLPGMDKEEAIHLAEAIRKEVEDSIFRIIPDLFEKRKPIDVRITLSLGVATIPDDAENSNQLLRNADRALYIGGKQAGRNRVGVYGEEVVGSVSVVLE